MLIQRGKEEGWLHLDITAMRTWAVANGIAFVNATPTEVPGRGVGLLADNPLHSRADEPTVVLTIPEDLGLSVETVRRHAQFDKDFREVLESLGEFGRVGVGLKTYRHVQRHHAALLHNLNGVMFGAEEPWLIVEQTPRGAILFFLLFQASVSCPHLPERLGVHCPLTEYVKTLPCELLPTFWNPEELQLLTGTTLAPAVSAKMKSLHREYELLCDTTARTRWYRLVQSFLAFEDWLHVDAMFRSRALDFYGSCMIPGLDLASHAAGDETNARYDRENRQYVLRLMDDKAVEVGHEVTITYGDEKGACEMLFSYGFIDAGMDTAETLFLSLTVPESDSLRAAKLKVADCAPGFKIMDVVGGAKVEDVSREEGQIDWKGDFIWLLCVGEQEGLRFELARTFDGQEELHATFQGVGLTHGAGDLRHFLSQSKLWPVYRLRAVVILQQRVFDQLQLLYSTQEDVEAVPHGDALAVRSSSYASALKLRRLEFQLLETAYEDFEKQKLALAEDPIVKRYLSEMNAQSQADDFA